MTKITISFYDNFDLLSINNRFEAAEFKPEPTTEKTINYIKDNDMKSIAPSAINLLATTSFDANFDPLMMKNSLEASKFEPGKF